MERDTDTASEHHTDAANAFYESQVAKYADVDAAHAAAEDGLDVEAVDDAGAIAGRTQDDGTTEDEGTTEHTDADTPATPDGDDAASEEDSEADDVDEHPDDADDAAEDSDDDDAPDDEDAADETDDDDDGEEEDEDVSETTTRVLAARGADLKLEDVPAEYQPIIKGKLRLIDSAFTRAMQEVTAFRTERTRLEAEERFRTENPDIVIVEMLRKDPDLAEKINTRMDKLDDPDQATAFEIVAKDKRKGVADAINAARAAEVQTQTRVQQVVATAQQAAETAGLPWKRAEKAIVLALYAKSDNPAERDLSPEEIAAVIAGEAKEHALEGREVKRKASREVVRERTRARTPVVPGTKKVAAASSPRIASEKKPEIDWNNEESRQAAMLRSARKIAPGVRER